MTKQCYRTRKIRWKWNARQRCQSVCRINDANGMTIKHLLLRYRPREIGRYTVHFVSPVDHSADRSIVHDRQHTQNRERDGTLEMKQRPSTRLVLCSLSVLVFCLMRSMRKQDKYDRQTHKRTISRLLLTAEPFAHHKPIDNVVEVSICWVAEACFQFVSLQSSRLPIGNGAEVFIFIDDFVLRSPVLFAVAVALRIHYFALKRNFPLADDVWVDWATRTPNKFKRKTIDKFKATNPTNSDGKLLNHYEVLEHEHFAAHLRLASVGLCCAGASMRNIPFEFHRLIAKYRKRACMRSLCELTTSHIVRNQMNENEKMEKEACVLFVNRIQSNWIMTIINVSSRKMRIHWTRIIYIFSIRDLPPRTFFMVFYLIMHLYRDTKEKWNEWRAATVR